MNAGAARTRAFPPRTPTPQHLVLTPTLTCCLWRCPPCEGTRGALSRWAASWAPTDPRPPPGVLQKPCPPSRHPSAGKSHRIDTHSPHTDQTTLGCFVHFRSVLGKLTVSTRWGWGAGMGAGMGAGCRSAAVLIKQGIGVWLAIFAACRPTKARSLSGLHCLHCTVLDGSNPTVWRAVHPCLRSDDSVSQRSSVPAMQLILWQLR